MKIFALALLMMAAPVLHAAEPLIVVQALNRLRTLAPDIPLSPVSADNLAKRLNLRHYPALMTATGIEQ